MQAWLWDMQESPSQSGNVAPAPSVLQGMQQGIELWSTLPRP